MCIRDSYIDAPVVADWLPPDEFGRAFERATPAAETATNPTAARRMPRAFAWRPFGAALALVAVALLAQVLLTDLPLRAYPDRPALVQLVSGDLDVYKRQGWSGHPRRDPRAGYVGRRLHSSVYR